MCIPANGERTVDGFSRLPVLGTGSPTRTSRWMLAHTAAASTRAAFGGTWCKQISTPQFLFVKNMFCAHCIRNHPQILFFMVKTGFEKTSSTGKNRHQNAIVSMQITLFPFIIGRPVPKITEKSPNVRNLGHALYVDFQNVLDSPNIFFMVPNIVNRSTMSMQMKTGNLSSLLKIDHTRGQAFTYQIIKNCATTESAIMRELVMSLDWKYRCTRASTLSRLRRTIVHVQHVTWSKIPIWLAAWKYKCEKNHKHPTQGPP